MTTFLLSKPGSGQDGTTHRTLNNLNDTSLPDPTDSDHHCGSFDTNYQPTPAVICAICFVFGILYSFFGYRFFKATMFMTGFIFGCLLTYLICLEENLLSVGGKIGVSLAVGLLSGLITMLVQYVGLFMTGFNFGLLISIAVLIVMEQFYHPYIKWIPIGIFFATGLVFALLGLYFQKGVTIFGTSIFGAALMTVAVDYFVENSIMVNYVWERIRAEYSETVCWYSWLILALWPALFILGSVIQWRLTSKGFDHHQEFRSRRQQHVNLKRVRERERERDHRESQPSRYRHLYQVRRVNGDVISRSYIQSIHKNLSPAMRSLTQLQGDSEQNSTNTTLTQVPS